MIQLHPERTPNVLRTIQMNSNCTLTRLPHVLSASYMVGRAFQVRLKCISECIQGVLRIITDFDIMFMGTMMVFASVLVK
jgi:hypothetical protein